MQCQQPKRDDPVPNGVWVHTACGRERDHWVKEFGYAAGCQSWRFGENVYEGDGTFAAARAAVSWWLHSDAGHRSTLLDSRWTDLAIGTVDGTFQGKAGDRVWVALFGYCS